MDKLDQRILRRFRVLTKEGEYAMIDFHEIAKEFDDFDVDTLKIKDAVDRLEYKNFVKVKYIDTDECCLTVTPKSRSIKGADTNGEHSMRIGLVYCGIASAIGAFLACLLYFEVFA